MEGAPPQVPSLVGIGARRGDEEIKNLVYRGIGRMPGFPQLTDDDIWGLVAYMKSGQSRDVAHDAEAPGLKYRFTGYRKFLDPDGYPAVAPPWGTLTAIDLNTGASRGRCRSASTRRSRRKGLANTGSENYGGPVVTAGGLVFIGATSFDKRFRAFDKATGALLWEATLPFSGTGTPATYEVAGRQFVVTPAAGGKDGGPTGGLYVAFALPARRADALPAPARSAAAAVAAAARVAAAAVRARVARARAPAGVRRIPGAGVPAAHLHPGPEAPALRARVDRAGQRDQAEGTSQSSTSGTIVVAPETRQKPRKIVATNDTADGQAPDDERQRLHRVGRVEQTPDRERADARQRRESDEGQRDAPHRDEAEEAERGRSGGRRRRTPTRGRGRAVRTAAG